VRDLIRARYQVQKQQHRARQQLKMFLLRQNIRYAGKNPWMVKLPYAEQQFVFQEMVNVISDAGQRLARYEKVIASVVEGCRWAPVVQALMSLRGVAGLAAVIWLGHTLTMRISPPALWIRGPLIAIIDRART